MPNELQVKRYAAFYRGWCQAFGEHEGEIEESADLNWIYSEQAIGLVMSSSLQKRLMRRLLGKGRERPCITLASNGFTVEREWINLSSEPDIRGLERVRALLSSGLLVHMFMTSHFYYPSGTRIITFSTRKPLPIMYKEIQPLCVRMQD